MPKCPQHQRELSVMSTGSISNRPWKRIECREPGCTALSGPPCNDCILSTHVRMQPCAAPAGEKPWGREPVRHFKCVNCGKVTWRFQSELDHRAAWEKRAIEILAPFYKAK